MPKLESLRILGFKSFAEKTEVRFDAGVTAIVGPNGCGKSNIADAINWVVGEQSAKSLRADRMEDVIFNGTGRRKALSFTEVTMQLSEFERIIPAGDGNPEIRQVVPVAVTRRLDRSGESEYYIDEKRCRLKDIYELFEGTGLGHKSYALIEQGRIEQILNAKPQERRALIEEAAKVSVYRSRKKAAEIKLQLANQNLLRVGDIITEVTRQARSLKRQAAKARRYGRLREELRQTHRCRIYLEFSRVMEKLSQVNDELGSYRDRDRECLDRNVRFETERAELMRNVEELEKGIQGWRESLSRIDVETERIEQQLHFQGQQIEEARRLGLQAVERIAAIEKKERALEENQLQQINQLEEAREDLRMKRHEAEEIRFRLETIQGEMDAAREELEGWRHRSIAHTEQLAQLRNESIRLAENRSHLARQCERVRLEQEQAASDHEALQESLRESRSRLARCESQWETLRHNHEDLSEHRADLETRQEKDMEAYGKLTDQYSMLRHRLASLEEMERRRSNYSEGMQKFLTSASTESLRVSGTVADLIEAEPEFEVIIEDYLDEQLQYVVVKDLSDAIRGVEHVKEIHAGKCTFISLAGVNGHTVTESNGGGLAESDQRGVVGRLCDQLRMDTSLEGALRRVVPDFASTYIVEDMNRAVELSHQHPNCAFLTLRGEYLTSRGLLSAAGEHKSTAGLLSLRREKRQLGAESEKIRIRLEEARASIAQQRAQIHECHALLARSQQELHQSELDKTRLTQDLAALEKESARQEQVRRIAELERERIEREQSGLGELTSRIEAQILELEQTSQSSEKTRNELMVRLDEQRATKEETASELADARTEIAALGERVRNIEHDCERYTREHGELKAQRLQAANSAADSEESIRTLTLSNERLQEELSRLRAEHSSQSSSLRNDLAAHQQTKDESVSLEKNWEELRAARDAVREKLSELQVDRARSETELEGLDRSSLEEFQVSSRELVERFDASTLTASRETVAARYIELRGQVENFGAINMSALEEFQACEERYQFLLAQQSDVQESIATTQKTIEELNKHSIQQFKAAFARINSHFSEVFKLLFDGGHAEMKLLDEEDPAESGIEINASPPGKRLQNVMLLSGGEKALTALALLMGIFKFQPGPFCVLDEVDAPLDDTNVLRLANMVEGMSDHTQFILITHNKLTLEAARYLYGVTMQEPGVSKVISVRFN